MPLRERPAVCMYDSVALFSIVAGHTVVGADGHQKLHVAPLQVSKLKA